MAHLLEVVPGYFTIRTHFKILGGLVDIGTHMAFLRLSNGKYLVLDTVPLNNEIKKEIDHLTDNGNLMEAVLGTHPFHTLYFPPFFEAYPSVPFYGTPRHIRNFTNIPWAGCISDCQVLTKWEPEVFMRIPAGAEWISPVPEKSNHFTNVFVYHKPSRTVFNDDTVLIPKDPNWIFRLFGFRHEVPLFHPSMTGPGLYPTPEAPLAFEEWFQKLLDEWDFENILSAHQGMIIGGAKEKIQKLLDETRPKLHKLSKNNEKKKPDPNAGAWSNDPTDGCECG